MENKIEIFGSDIGGWMYRLMWRLFPICRSISGEGVRETLFYTKRFYTEIIDLINREYYDLNLAV
jgi:aminopeptidase-like protein